MRRRLLENLPTLSEAYGLRPCDVDEMTLREINEYLTQLAEAQQQQEA